MGKGKYDEEIKSKFGSVFYEGYQIGLAKQDYEKSNDSDNHLNKSLTYLKKIFCLEKINGELENALEGKLGTSYSSLFGSIEMDSREIFDKIEKAIDKLKGLESKTKN